MSRSDQYDVRAGSVPQAVPRHIRAAQIIFLGLAAALVICVTLQVFIAGLATFAAPAYWAQHTSFVHLFELLPPLMLALGAAGRLPRRLLWQTAGVLLLTFVQYATANIGGRAPLVAALHPVVALAIFWVSLDILRRARRHLRGAA